MKNFKRNFKALAIVLLILAGAGEKPLCRKPGMGEGNKAVAAVCCPV